MLSESFLICKYRKLVPLNQNLKLKKSLAQYLVQLIILKMKQLKPKKDSRGVHKSLFHYF